MPMMKKPGLTVGKCVMGLGKCCGIYPTEGVFLHHWLHTVGRCPVPSLRWHRAAAGGTTSQVCCRSRATLLVPPSVKGGDRFWLAGESRQQ